jgi:hypothetical protein
MVHDSLHNMPEEIPRYSVFSIIIDNIRFLNFSHLGNNEQKEISDNMLEASPDNFFTCFPQKLWKTLKSPIVTNVCLVLLSFAVLSSCTYFKGGKKQDKASQEASAAEAPQSDSEKKAPAPAKEPPKAKPVPDTSVIDMTEAEVKKKFGEPDIVSKMPDNRIIWTYQPTWKIMPDNKDTVYIEFENGKVVKMIRAR